MLCGACHSADRCITGRSSGAIQWSPSMTKSFEKLKEALCKDVVVHIPDFAAPFLLQTNALDNVLGAILLQQQEGEDLPVVFASHKFNTTEVRYATIEKQCLVIHWAIEYFQYYLLEWEFVVITDHVPLPWLMKSHIENVLITRWALALPPFKFLIVH